VIAQREAVEHDGQTGGLFVEHRHGVAGRLARVHDERQTRTARQRDLRREGAPLRVPR